MTTDQDKKRHLAHSYYTDSGQFLHRAVACLAMPLAQRFSYQGKIASDLIMSIECALKSLLVTHAPEADTAKEVFGRLLRFSHHIDKLSEAALAAGAPLSQAAQQDLPQVYRLSVSLRYALESFSEITLGQQLPSDFDFSTPEGMQRLRLLSEELSALCKSEMEREFSELIMLDGSQIKSWFRDLAEFTKKA
jgi:hypothetical protein